MGRRCADRGSSASVRRFRPYQMALAEQKEGAGVHCNFLSESARWRRWGITAASTTSLKASWHYSPHRRENCPYLQLAWSRPHGLERKIFQGVLRHFTLSPVQVETATGSRQSAFGQPRALHWLSEREIAGEFRHKLRYSAAAAIHSTSSLWML